MLHHKPTAPQAAPDCGLCVVYQVGKENSAMASSGVPPVLTMSPQLQGLGVISYLGFTRSHKLDLRILISAARADQQQGDFCDLMVAFLLVQVYSEHNKQDIFGTRCSCSSECGECAHLGGTWSGRTVGHPASLLQAAPLY